MPWRFISFLLLTGVTLVVDTSLPAAPAAPKPPPLPASAIKDMAAILRTMIIQSMPPVLYEGQHNWGHQANVLDGITWRGKGGGIKAEVRRKPKNDGTWRKVRVTPRNLDRLVFELRHWQNVAADRITFTAFLGFEAEVRFDQQIWESGVRLYAGDTRARFRVKLNLNCELLTRVETNKKSILPDFVFRLRVTKSDLTYDDLVVEHTAGIGGTGAKVLGEAMHKAVKQFRPDLERDLLAKANATIVKAADTREVRLSLGGLLAPGSATPKKLPPSAKKK